MASYRKFLIRASNIIKRRFATENRPPRPLVEVDPEVCGQIERTELKARQHPGLMKPRSVGLPERIQRAAVQCLQDTPSKSLTNDSVTLVNYLQSRHPPPEDWQLRAAKTRVQRCLSESFDLDVSKKSPAQIDRINQAYDNEFVKLMKANVYNWKAIPYDRYTALNYLIGRGAPEYAVLARIFNEIKTRDPAFDPKTFFDFGSGIGTGTWALRECWNGPIEELFTVDTSSEMNDLAKALLTAAYSDGPVREEKIFQRQFLPSIPRSYDLVLSAYSLLELPSAKSRLETILNLWKKTDRYLVIAEHGTNVGFNLVNEARDFVLNFTEEKYKGHVFAPCPHDSKCPRIVTDKTPCNYEVKYQDLKLKRRKDTYAEYYCYVVLKKGERADGDPVWPRIVRPTLLRTRHTVCRMCRSNGKLQEIVFTAAKHGKVASSLAKVSNWGDRLPITIIDPPADDNMK